MEWFVNFRASVKELRKIAETPSRLRAFIRWWACRGRCIAENPVTLLYEINDDQLAAPGPWAELRDLTHLEVCRLSEPGEAPEPRNDVLKWEDWPGATSGAIASTSREVRSVFVSLLRERTALQIIDPYFWTNSSKFAREWMFKEVSERQVARVHILSRAPRSNEMGKDSRPATVAEVREELDRLPDELAVIVSANVVDNVHMHDRFFGFSLSESTVCQAWPGTVISLGAGVAALGSFDRPCAVLPVSSGDFGNLWGKYLASGSGRLEASGAGRRQDAGPGLCQPVKSEAGGAWR